MEVHMRFIFFLIVMVSSATGEVKKLTVTEGGSISLPDPVVDTGFLSFGINIIASVNKREVTIFGDIYTNRLQWDKNTGLFTITGMQRNDSGIYNIDSKTGRTFITSYKLTVFESVPTPAVNTSSVSAESCILLCFVDEAEETTLLWYKDEEILNRSSSVLSLPLTVHKQDFSSSYRCVAANPAEEKPVVVDVKIFCGQNNTDNSDVTSRSYYLTLIISILGAVIVLSFVAIITKGMYFNKTKTTTRQDSVTREILYTDVNISQHRPSQTGNFPDSSGTVDRSNLTTVYDQLEAHRMSIYTDTAENV